LVSRYELERSSKPFSVGGGDEVVVKKTMTVDVDKCMDCGECLSLRPVEAIQMSTGYTIVFDEDECAYVSTYVLTCV